MMWSNMFVDGVDMTNDVYSAPIGVLFIHDSDINIDIQLRRLDCCLSITILIAGGLVHAI